MTGYTKLTVFILSGAVLSAAAFFFLLQPALDRVSALTEEERKTQAEAKRLEQQIIAYKTAQSDLSKATNKELLYSTIVTDKNLHIPIQEVETGAKITGTTYQLKILRDSIDDVAPAGRRTARVAPATRVTSENGLEEIPYTLTVQDPSYPDMITFLKYLEHIPHFTEVSKMDMTYQESEGANQVTAIINGVFLVKKDETAN